VAGLRKGGGTGGGGASGGANMKTIILGVITIVIALIMLGIAMDVVTALLDDVTIDWTVYPGAEAILGIFPLLMLIALVLFGGVLVWIGYTGGSMGIKGTIMTTIVVVVAVILLPIVIDATDTLLGRPDIGDYTGLSSFLGLVPLLYVIGTMFMTGILGYKAVGGEVRKRRKSSALV
jgi:hypothetical protein